MESLAEMETAVEALAEAIKELEGSREALIPNFEETEIACTGSMEPVITCLDSVILVTDPRYEDIPIGAVVVFRDLGRRVLHRVIEIEIDADGVRWFRTQGDAVLKSDQSGIGTHQRNVVGYVAEIKRDTHPENAALRDKVNTVRAKHDAAWEEYQRVLNRYCRGAGADNECPAGTALDRARAAFDAYTRAFYTYRNAYYEALCAAGARVTGFC